MPRGRPKKRPAYDLNESSTSDVSGQQEVDVYSDRPEVSNSDVKQEPQPSDEEEEFIEVELDVDDVPSTSSSRMSPLKSPLLRQDCMPRKIPFKKSKRGTSSVPRLIAEQSKPRLKAPRSSVPIRTPTTRAAAMHSLMLESMKREIDDEPESDYVDAVSNVCDVCTMELLSQIELFEHRRAYHKELVKKEDVVTGSLMCGHPHCNASFPDVGHLIAHLVAYHNQQQYRIRKLNFDQIDKFEAWQKDMEQNSRCAFIASKEPEGCVDNPEVYRVQMYCEYCDEWRLQAERGPAHPQQVPNKIIGCPAHFTATIDNKKDKASIVGCFAHLGHHKKPSWSAIPCDTGQKVERNVQPVKCNDCDMVFRTRAAAGRHHRSEHPAPEGAETDGRRTQGEVKMPSLECGDQECDVVCDSMATLVQHVAEAHRREDLVVEEYKFNNMADFEQWKTRMESDTCSHYTKVSGRCMPNDISKYYLCHLSGHTNRNRRKSVEEKVRNRPTKKMGRYCTAFMSLKCSNSDKSVTIRGCLGHFGHSFDVRRLPVPEHIRKEMAELLMKGCSEDEVLQIIRSRCQDNERGHWLQRYEVRNMTLKMHKEGRLVKAVYNQEEDEREWEDSMSLSGAYQLNPEEVAHFQPQSYTQILRSPEEPRVPGRFKGMRSLAEIHGSRRRNHLVGETRYMARNVDKQAMLSAMDLVEYEDAGDYTGDGEIVEMREVEGMMDAGGGAYYEGFEEDTRDEKVVSLPHHHLSAQVVTPRKRIPLLKEPTATGNADYDDMMQHIKDRIHKVSQQLKDTHDAHAAEVLQKELRALEAQLVAEGIGQTTVPVMDHMQQQPHRWQDQGPFSYEYGIPDQVVHEEEVVVDPTEEMTYGDDMTGAEYHFMQDPDGQDPIEVEVETEEIVS